VFVCSLHAAHAAGELQCTKEISDLAQVLTQIYCTAAEVYFAGVPQGYKTSL